MNTLALSSIGPRPQPSSPPMESPPTQTRTGSASVATQILGGGVALIVDVAPPPEPGAPGALWRLSASAATTATMTTIATTSRRSRRRACWRRRRRGSRRGPYEEVPKSIVSGSSRRVYRKPAGGADPRATGRRRDERPPCAAMAVRYSGAMVTPAPQTPQGPQVDDQAPDRHLRFADSYGLVLRPADPQLLRLRRRRRQPLRPAGDAAPAGRDDMARPARLPGGAPAPALGRDPDPAGDPGGDRRQRAG